MTTRIDGTANTNAVYDASGASGSNDAALRASLLPEPPPGCDGIAAQMARMVLASAHSQRQNARESETAQERAACAAEDRVVEQMRQKASNIRTTALVEGATMAVAAGGSAYGACANKKGFEVLGSQTFEGAKVLGSFSAAGQTEIDGEIEASRATARRALRGADDAKKDVDDVGELANKALAFARDSARTESDTQMAAIRRA